MHTREFATDAYEYTMLSSAVADGTADKECVFETFTRKTPTGPAHTLAGTHRLIDTITALHYTPGHVAMLHDAGLLTPAAAHWLTDWRFTGDIDGYAEGELFFEQSPILSITARYGDAILLETLILSILNYDSAIATAAARIVTAAQGRTLVDMGSRRTHEHAAVAAARAAWIAGFDATSNVAAALEYDIPWRGTSAHAHTLARTTEKEAFATQVAVHGPETTLLVDTYNTEQGIHTALEVAGAHLGAIRIDSGDLGAQARYARAALDAAGATDTKIVVTGDLDADTISALAEDPIDGYGVGTRLVTGEAVPSLGLVYKLVAIADNPNDAMRPVAKRSPGKHSVGGRKHAWRALDSNGHATSEHITVTHTDTPPTVPGRPLQIPLVRQGSPMAPTTAAQGARAARIHHQQVLAELPTHLSYLPESPAIAVHS